MDQIEYLSSLDFKILDADLVAGLDEGNVDKQVLLDLFEGFSSVGIEEYLPLFIMKRFFLTVRNDDITSGEMVSSFENVLDGMVQVMKFDKALMSKLFYLNYVKNVDSGIPILERIDSFTAVAKEANDLVNNGATNLSHIKFVVKRIYLTLLLHMVSRINAETIRVLSAEIKILKESDVPSAIVSLIQLKD